MLFVSETETQEKRHNTSVLESEIIPHVFKSYLEKIDREKQKWEICMFCKKRENNQKFSTGRTSPVLCKDQKHIVIIERKNTLVSNNLDTYDKWLRADDGGWRLSPNF